MPLAFASVRTACRCTGCGSLSVVGSAGGGGEDAGLVVVCICASSTVASGRPSSLSRFGDELRERFVERGALAFVASDPGDPEADRRSKARLVRERAVRGLARGDETIDVAQ